MHRCEIMVDPLNVAADQHPIVARFMQDLHVDPPLYVDVNEPAPVGYHSILFTRIMFRYTSRKYGSVRYGVAEASKLGTGSYGDVYKITHTLSIDAVGTVICKHKSIKKMRAVKVFIGDGDQQDTAEHEFNMLSLIREMAVKRPQHLLRRSTLFMRFIPGRTLFQCIAEHQNGVKPMTILERLVLSRNLFAALQKQVHQNGLVHRDIKPENIMVGPDGKITIVDFNLAKLASHDDRGESNGTALYAPPEVFDGGLTNPQSDIYCMGRVVWQLFDWNVYAYRIANSQEIECRKDYYSLPCRTGDIPNLFAKTTQSELPLEDQAEIKKLLLQINRYDKYQRPTIDAILAVFDVILSKRTDYVMPRVKNAITASASSELEPIAAQNEEVVPNASSASGARLFQPASRNNDQSSKRYGRGCVIS